MRPIEKLYTILCYEGWAIPLSDYGFAFKKTPSNTMSFEAKLITQINVKFISDYCDTHDLFYSITYDTDRKSIIVNFWENLN